MVVHAGSRGSILMGIIFPLGDAMITEVLVSVRTGNDVDGWIPTRAEDLLLLLFAPGIKLLGRGEPLTGILNAGPALNEAGLGRMGVEQTQSLSTSTSREEGYSGSICIPGRDGVSLRILPQLKTDIL